MTSVLTSAPPTVPRDDLLIVRHDTPPSQTPSPISRQGSFPVRGLFMTPGRIAWQHLGLTACRGIAKLGAE